jgi:hypothetical protein
MEGLGFGIVFPPGPQGARLVPCVLPWPASLGMCPSGRALGLAKRLISPVTYPFFGGAAAKSLPRTPAVIDGTRKAQGPGPVKTGYASPAVPSGGGKPPSVNGSHNRFG